LRFTRGLKSTRYDLTDLSRGCLLVKLVSLKVDYGRGNTAKLIELKGTKVGKAHALACLENMRQSSTIVKDKSGIELQNLEL
jgi:hypothetical protein